MWDHLDIPPLATTTYTLIDVFKKLPQDSSGLQHTFYSPLSWNILSPLKLKGALMEEVKKVKPSQH